VPDSEDDPRIPDSAELWRRIPPDWVTWDDEQQRLRPSSQAFKNHRESGAISVFLANAISGPEYALQPPNENFYLASITAGFARSVGLAVTADPPVPDVIGHAWLKGLRSNKTSLKLARGARWVVAPADPVYP
jgi:hypothetical protein